MLHLKVKCLKKSYSNLQFLEIPIKVGIRHEEIRSPGYVEPHMGYHWKALGPRMAT